LCFKSTYIYFIVICFEKKTTSKRLIIRRQLPIQRTYYITGICVNIHILCRLHRTCLFSSTCLHFARKSCQNSFWCLLW